MTEKIQQIIEDAVKRFESAQDKPRLLGCVLISS